MESFGIEGVSAGAAKLVRPGVDLPILGGGLAVSPSMAGVFPAMVLAALRRTPARTAFEVGPVSYGELLALVRRLTAGLQRAGLGPGVSVGMVLS